MAEKTYKYISTCERLKPIQTNNRQLFIMHVAACPTCRRLLPGEVLKGLDPEVSQIVAERAKGKEEPSIPSSEETEESAVEPTSDQPIVEKKEPAEETVPDEPGPQEEFDTRMKTSPVFQGIQKSVMETNAHVESLSGEVNGLSGKISSEIQSLGDTLIERMVGGQGADREVVDVGKVAEEERKEPPEDEREERPEDEEKEPPGKVLSSEEEKVQEAGGGLAGAGGRPSPFGEPEKLPAAMRQGYHAGEKRKEEVVGEEPPREGEKPPEDEERVPDKEPAKKEAVPKGGKGMPDLTDPKEIEALEAWIYTQKKKMGETGKPGTPEPEPAMTGVVKPFMGDLTQMIKEGRSLVKAWKGEEEQPPAVSSDINQAITFAKVMNEFSTSQMKNVFEMIRTMREGEKLVSSFPAREATAGSSPSAGPNAIHVK